MLTRDDSTRTMEPLAGSKGGPGPKNLAEFQKCVNQLNELPSRPHLSKFVILLYADPTDGSLRHRRYSLHYDRYQHADESVALQLLESGGPIAAPGHVLQARLYSLGAPPNKRLKLTGALK